MSDIMDPNILQEYNVSFDDVFYYAPRPLVDYPYTVVVCLILSSPFREKIPNEYSLYVRTIILYQ